MTKYLIEVNPRKAFPALVCIRNHPRCPNYCYPFQPLATCKQHLHSDCLLVLLPQHYTQGFGIWQNMFVKGKLPYTSRKGRSRFLVRPNKNGVLLLFHSSCPHLTLNKTLSLSNAPVFIQFINPHINCLHSKTKITYQNWFGVFFFF